MGENSIWNKCKAQSKRPISEMGNQGTKSNFPFLSINNLKKVLENRDVDVNATEDEEGKTFLMTAVSEEKFCLVSLLLEKPGIQVNSKDTNGWTALHFAASRKHQASSNHREINNIVKRLLNFPGIDMEVKDRNGETPLMCAIKYGQIAFQNEYRKMFEDAETRFN